ncbi:T-cell surface protein tactile [Platysternon megacephalum]|uniref:T-cell surface protein tactile n=1 Tax=Platysternon megacephalum TaxID=55544 RepID=A0A4D9DTN6_9SAUR|nr:T-cell surface protein tactile [Platysternon megacephalum]
MHCDHFYPEYRGVVHRNYSIQCSILDGEMHAGTCYLPRWNFPTYDECDYNRLHFLQISSAYQAPVKLSMWPSGDNNLDKSVYYSKFRTKLRKLVRTSKSKEKWSKAFSSLCIFLTLHYDAFLET